MWAPFSVLGRYLEFLDRRERPTVLVIGSGWGAHAFVGAIDHKRYQVRVLSPRGTRLNQPSLIHNFPNFNTENLVTHLSPAARQIEDIAVELKEDSKTVKGLKGDYSYDHLVIATGSEAFDFNVKGVQEHCLMCKTDTDMEQMRKVLETKDAIVLGAGPTGIELACKLKSEGVHVRILEATSTILPGFSEGMRSAVTTYLSNIELPVTTNSPVQSITNDAILLKNGQPIPYQGSALLWTCGIRPPAFVRQLTGGAPLTVDPFLRYKKEIYALGDSVKGYPPTAQNAKQQGIWLAQHFNQTTTSPYEYHEQGRLLDLTYAIFIEYQGIVWHIPYFLTPLVRALKE
uniref:NADH:ubiquinone reductase (non-electrogenic) n=1 Tax=viral metagenome TaxID=1070528 RepID=A0A6C0JZQ5_9ZZZZ